MTLIGVEWLQEVAVTFFLVFTLIWGPPKIILPRAPQSVRPGLAPGITSYLAINHFHTRTQVCQICCLEARRILWALTLCVLVR